MSTSTPASGPGPTPEAPARRDPALLVVLGLIVLLVVVALVVVFTRGQPTPLDPDTPGGVVQSYSTAVLDGDEATAEGYLTAGALLNCEGTTSPVTEDIRLTLVDTTERDATADVRVLIVTSYQGGPFGPSEYESEDVFNLEKVDGSWLIASAPWAVAICPPGGTR